MFDIFLRIFEIWFFEQIFPFSVNSRKPLLASNHINFSGFLSRVHFPPNILVPLSFAKDWWLLSDFYLVGNSFLPPSLPLFPFNAKLPLKHQKHHYPSNGVSRRHQRAIVWFVKTSERATAIPSLPPSKRF